MSETWNEPVSGPEVIDRPNAAADARASLDDFRMPVREGLPRAYRMRADPHYVDQLATAAGQPVRLIPLAEIDGDDVASEHDIRPLIESVRVHGFIQPLVVRRVAGRYGVVVGRKRLATAHALQLPTVPCLIREVSEDDARVLQTADNLRLAPAPGVVAEPGSATPFDIALSHTVLAAHLAAIRQHTERSDESGEPLRRVAAGLVDAHTWRAERLLDSLRLIRGEPFPSSRDRALTTILDAVIDGFAPECGLSDVSLRGEVPESLWSSGFNGHELLAAIAAAIVAMFPVAHGASRRVLTVRLSSAEPAGIICEVDQPSGLVSADVLAAFFDAPCPARRGGVEAGLAALAVKAFAERHGGCATVEPTEGGTRLTLTMIRRS